MSDELLSTVKRARAWRTDDLSRTLDEIRTHLELVRKGERQSYALEASDFDDFDELLKLLERSRPTQAQLRTAIAQAGRLAAVVAVDWTIAAMVWTIPLVLPGVKANNAAFLAQGKNREMQPARCEAMQAAVNRAHAENPTASHTALCKHVAKTKWFDGRPRFGKRHKYSAKQIARNTEDPTKK